MAATIVTIEFGVSGIHTGYGNKNIFKSLFNYPDMNIRYVMKYFTFRYLFYTKQVFPHNATNLKIRIWRSLLPIRLARFDW